MTALYAQRVGEFEPSGLSVCKCETHVLETIGEDMIDALLLIEDTGVMRYASCMTSLTMELEKGSADNIKPQPGSDGNIKPQPGSDDNIKPQPGSDDNIKPQPGSADSMKPVLDLLKRFPNLQYLTLIHATSLQVPIALIFLFLT